MWLKNAKFGHWVIFLNPTTYCIYYSWKIWQKFIFGGLAVFLPTTKLKSINISSSHMYIWRSCTEWPNINPAIMLAMVSWDSTTKFNSHHYIVLGISYTTHTKIKFVCPSVRKSVHLHVRGFSGGRSTSTRWSSLWATEQAGSNEVGVSESACPHCANVLGG